jgi:hypothetical protein
MPFSRLLEFGRCKIGIAPVAPKLVVARRQGARLLHRICRHHGDDALGSQAIQSSGFLNGKRRCVADLGGNLVDHGIGFQIVVYRSFGSRTRLFSSLGHAVQVNQ